MEGDYRWRSPSAPKTTEGTREMYSLGGKLPGFFGGALIRASGGNTPNGDEFSTRMMWHGEGASGQGYSNGRAHQGTFGPYLYYNGRSADIEWLDGFPILQRDTWITVRQRVVMNSPGVGDGIVQVWVDGVQVYDRRDIEFRSASYPSLGIEGIAMHLWRGGNSNSYTSDYDVLVDLRDFKVWAP